MVNNTEFAIICSIGCFSFGGLAYIGWKGVLRNIYKYKKYNKRIAHMQDPDNFITPDSINSEFYKLTDEEKKLGKELMVTGYAISLKAYLQISQNQLKISPELTKYMEGLPREIAMVDRAYPNLELEYKAWGNKFAIQHRSENTIFIEPYKDTHLIGFEEFYHKKGFSFSEFLSDFGGVSNKNSGRDLASWILFEGDYITAFGIVKYQTSDGSLSMTKPIAIVKGGLDSLWDLFIKKREEKGAKIYGYLWLATVCTVATVGWFIAARSLLKTVQKRNLEQNKEKTKIDSLNCSKCGENKRNILFKPCHHILYCKNCFDKDDFDQGLKDKCEQCGEKIESSEKIYIP